MFLAPFVPESLLSAAYDPTCAQFDPDCFDYVLNFFQHARDEFYGTTANPGGLLAAQQQLLEGGSPTSDFGPSPSQNPLLTKQAIIVLREELEYFCVGHPEWAVRDLPEPTNAVEQDHDHTRFAVLATLAHIICDVFNRRIELGLPRDAPAIVEDWEELARRPKVYEEVPRWAREAEPLPEGLRIPNAKGEFVEAGSAAACVRAKQMNILMHEPDVHFV